MKRTSLLGKGSWEWCSGRVRCGGVDKIWSDKEATPETLIAALPEHHKGEHGDFVYIEWQKVGRRINRVEVKRLTVAEPIGKGTE